MLWVIYALSSAFFLATTDALTKKSLEDSDEYFVAWVRLFFSSPFLLLGLIFIEIPRIDGTFWLAILLSIPLEVLALILYIRAIKISPLSLTVPFLAFTPLFLILTSFIILGEKPDRSGTAGIILITLGVYLLNLQRAYKGIFEPLKAILKEKGSVLMLLVALIYSITSNLGKLAIQHSSPVFFGIVYFLVLNIVFFPIMLLKSENPFLKLKNNISMPLAIGLFSAIMILFHTLAINLTYVSYMIAVKRTSLLFSIGYGYFLFREENILEKLAGGIMMVAGVILIVFF